MSPRPWCGVVMTAVLPLYGCLSGSAGNVLLNTGIALGASAVSRSSGGCYAACPVGTTCDKATGLCEQLPCRGECDPFQECIETRLSYRCVARGTANGALIANPTQAPSEQTTASPQP